MRLKCRRSTRCSHTQSHTFSMPCHPAVAASVCTCVRACVRVVCFFVYTFTCVCARVFMYVCVYVRGQTTPHTSQPTPLLLLLSNPFLLPSPSLFSFFLSARLARCALPATFCMGFSRSPGRCSPRPTAVSRSPHALSLSFFLLFPFCLSALLFTAPPPVLETASIDCKACKLITTHLSAPPSGRLTRQQTLLAFAATTR